MGLCAFLLLIALVESTVFIHPSPVYGNSSAQVQSLFVIHHKTLGIEWLERLEIHGSTNVVYRIRSLERPHIPWITWRDKMLIVTN
jgi:hypothetical protein